MEHFEIASLSLLPPPISLRVSLTPTVLDSYYSFFLHLPCSLGSSAPPQRAVG